MDVINCQNDVSDWIFIITVLACPHVLMALINEALQCVALAGFSKYKFLKKNKKTIDCL